MSIKKQFPKTENAHEPFHSPHTHTATHTKNLIEMKKITSSYTKSDSYMSKHDSYNVFYDRTSCEKKNKIRRRSRIVFSYVTFLLYALGLRTHIVNIVIDSYYEMSIYG